MHQTRSNNPVTPLIGVLFSMCCVMQLRAQVIGPEILYALTDSAFTLHEPVIVEFELRNETEGVVRADLGSDYKNGFVMAVRYPDGTTASEVSLPQVFGISLPGEITVGPGESYQQPLLLNEWINFQNVGQYSVEIALANPLWTASQEVVFPERFITTLDIRPRDETSLLETCERLASEIEAATSVTIAIRAAEALSYVSDNVAVPCMERALQSRQYVEAQIVAGLERIGTREAADVLIALLREAGVQGLDSSTQVETRVIHAQQGLSRIAARTANSDLRRYILESFGTSD